MPPQTWRSFLCRFFGPWKTKMAGTTNIISTTVGRHRYPHTTTLRRRHRQQVISRHHNYLNTPHQRLELSRLHILPTWGTNILCHHLFMKGFSTVEPPHWVTTIVWSISSRFRHLLEMLILYMVISRSQECRARLIPHRTTCHR